LTALAQSEPDPEKKTRFQQLLRAVKEVGLPVVTDVLAKVVEQQGGLR
jgi:hypothetical protein